MAGPTWRNVDAPQFDMRSMFQATQGLDSSFSRFGDMLSAREEKLRTEATDAALAQGYANQDPEAVAAMMSKGVGGMGPRVNGRAFMESMAKYKSDLIDSGFKNEQRLNIKDTAENGAQYLDYLDKKGRGLNAEADALVANNPTFRAWANYGQAGAQLFGDFEVRTETKANNIRNDENQDQDRSQRAAQAAAALAWDKQRTAMARADAAAARAEDKAERARGGNLQEAGAAWARQNIPLGTSPDQIPKIMGQMFEQNKIPFADRANFLQGATASHVARATPIKQDLMREVGGNRGYATVPGTGGAPAFMIPGSPEGKRAMSGLRFPDYLTGAQPAAPSRPVASYLNDADAQVKQSAADKDFTVGDYLRGKQEFAARFNEPKYKGTTEKQFIEDSKKQGISESTARAVLSRVTPSEAMAILNQNVYGARFGTDEYMATGRTTFGRDTFEGAVDKYIKEQPNFSRYEQELDDRTAVGRDRAAQLGALRQKIYQDSAGSDGPSIADIMLLNKLLEESKKHSSEIRARSNK